MTTQPPAPPAILASLAKIADQISKVGIEKAKKTESGTKFHYRGIDDVTWVMSGLFAEHKVLCVPSYAECSFELRKTTNSQWWIAHVRGTFIMTSLVDGSTITVGPVPGEAGDAGDKAMSKACSVSLRNALLQTFLAPIGPEMDPESSGMPEADVSQDPQPESRAPARKPQAAQGEVAGGPLTSGQEKIRDARLKQKGMTLESATAAFGVIDSASFNRFSDWLKAQ